MHSMLTQGVCLDVRTVFLNVMDVRWTFEKQVNTLSFATFLFELYSTFFECQVDNKWMYSLLLTSNAVL